MKRISQLRQPYVPHPLPIMPISERLTNFTVDDNGCHVWGGFVDGGYGRLRVRGKNWRVHRLSYVHHIGIIPDETKVVQSCGNRLCINPGHLSLRPVRKLTDAQVVEIRRRYTSEHVTHQQLADEFGISIGQMGIVLNPEWGMSYADVPTDLGMRWRPPVEANFLNDLTG